MSYQAHIRQLREEVQTNFNNLARACQANDRRNFEAFIFAKVVHRVLCKTPFLGKRYERAFQKELDAFVASMTPAGEKSAPVNNAAPSSAVKPATDAELREVLRAHGRIVKP
jgi:hypothetical protein